MPLVFFLSFFQKKSIDISGNRHCKDHSQSGRYALDDLNADGIHIDGLV